ncbi:N-formylglutamate amidohydrolase [Qingshengfaniella alkalisoli]|uniref:N-formylglutamate amidohydrolase n=1 Tax=Qingshengfaniella alkalisoli TaxID=2599296 RepID=A0A5B8I8K6_9RHOB|nr:N-formylglutamate amidohydrolase [Qingshengfaniella alkalisoli]QDY70355.1 N-formylglutamate amidohydrolase [Qingshengfaniella alkalisoli]
MKQDLAVAPLVPMPASVADVLTVTAPRTPMIPLVLDSPHSGTLLPGDFQPAVGPSMVRISADTHVDDLFSEAPDHGAPLLAALFPRSFLDVNRSLSDMDRLMVKGGWPHPTRDSNTARRGMGLIWRKAWGETPMYDAPLSIAEAEARIRRYWLSYHDALRQLLDGAFAQYRRVWHINCHSMTDAGHAMSSDGPGTARDDICIGDMHGTSAGPEFTALLREILTDEGFRVAMNKPFKGAELTEAYANPVIGRHSVQFEINRRLYMDETTRERSADYPAFKAAMTRLVERVADYIEGELS